MKRVYDAAIRHKLIAGNTPLTELAEVLGETAQRVKNWDGRGPSTEGLLMIQAKTGINATWISTGKGPEMVGGDDGAGTSKAAPTVATLLTQLSAVLIGLPPAGRHRIADMLSALALAPDSKQLHAGIKAEIESGGVGTAANDVLVDDGAKNWRKQAMRLAEANPNPQAKTLLADFLGKLDTLMRDGGGKTSKPPKTRHEG